MQRCGCRIARSKRWPRKCRATCPIYSPSTTSISFAREVSQFTSGRPSEEWTMPFAASLSTAAAAKRTVDEACSEALAALGCDSVDLALAFFSLHHAEDAGEIVRALTERLRPRALAGCQAEAVVGNQREVENAPALALWLAKWGESVGVESFHLQASHTPDGLTLLGWPDGLVDADPQADA